MDSERIQSDQRRSFRNRERLSTRKMARLIRKQSAYFAAIAVIGVVSLLVVMLGGGGGTGCLVIIVREKNLW